jgi:hypothetical protein
MQRWVAFPVIMYTLCKYILNDILKVCRVRKYVAIENL